MITIEALSHAAAVRAARAYLGQHVKLAFTEAGKVWATIRLSERGGAFQALPGDSAGYVSMAARPPVRETGVQWRDGDVWDDGDMLSRVINRSVLIIRRQQ